MEMENVNSLLVLQGQSNLHHHLMATNVQIIRSGTPALQIGSPAAPPHTFTSHLPRGQLKAILFQVSAHIYSVLC